MPGAAPRRWARMRRNTLRVEGNFAAADAIRQALSAAALDLSDTPDGSRWQPAETV